MDEQDYRPKATFFNLDPAKQEIIIRAAMDEFARQGYRGASLNVIVRKAGIAKGSLYQYFSNKEALFFYVFSCFVDLVKKSVGRTGADADFFEQLRQVLWAGINFIREYPRYFQFYVRVLAEDDVPGRKELLATVRFFSHEYFGPLCRLGQDQCLIRPDVTPAMAAFMVDSVMDRFFRDFASRFFGDDEDAREYDINRLEPEIEMIIKVLSQGLAGDGNRI